MCDKSFVVDVDGRRVAIDPAAQCVSLLTAAGESVSLARIQVAAGSLQGIFSMVEHIADVKTV